MFTGIGQSRCLAYIRLLKMNIVYDENLFKQKQNSVKVSVRIHMSISFMIYEQMVVLNIICLGLGHETMVCAVCFSIYL